MAAHHILITGAPGIGKTTLIKEMVAQLKTFSPVGFYTAEIRQRGLRRGFELIALDGRRSILAHVDIESPFRVGRYGVDVARFEQFLESLPFSDPSARLTVIDEIGKMELCSVRFRRLMDDLLNGPKPLLATVALKGGSYIVQVKTRQDVTLYEMNAANRTRMAVEILREITGA